MGVLDFQAEGIIYPVVKPAHTCYLVVRQSICGVQCVSQIAVALRIAEFEQARGRLLMQNSNA